MNKSAHNHESRICDISMSGSNCPRDLESFLASLLNNIRIANTIILNSVALDPGGSSYDRERESPDVVCHFFLFT